MAGKKKSSKTTRAAPKRAAKKASKHDAVKGRAKKAGKVSARPAKKTGGKVDPIPKGYRTVTPYLVVKGLAKLLPFLEKALGAKIKHRMAMPDGSVSHAEVKIGDSMVMLGEAGNKAKANTSMIYLYVKDTDKLYKQALKAGATSVMAPSDQFYGDRNAGVADPCGNQWWMGTRVENVSQKEMLRRMLAMAK